MEQELMCVGSDAVNRYRMIVTTEAMEKSLKTTFDKGMPMLIGHDFHKPIGWNIPFGLFIEPGLTRFLAKKIQATNVDELRTFRKALGNYLGETYEKDFLPHEKDFVPLVKKHLSSEHTRINAGCIAYVDEGLTAKLFPDLFSQNDKDGLVPLSYLKKSFTYLGQGVFKHNKSSLAIYAHQFFRRTQSRFNNFHFHFLDELMNLADKEDMTIRICIDEDMIGYAPSYHESGELEFHYGPQYSDNIDEIKPGITRHNCNESEKNYYEVDSTEFFWKKDENEKIFEMEELKLHPAPMDELYHCRYIHSIYDSSKKEFVHFDGAMRSYDENSMTERSGKTFLQFGKKAIYKKLFRVDGKLPLDKWKLLITHYYQNNPLIYEYFGFKEERDALKEEPAPVTRLQQLLPFDIKKEEGLKLLVSYHPIPKDFRQGRYLDIPDIMGNDEGKFNCIEKRVYDVKKVLQSMGEDLEIPEDWARISFEDRYWNIPSIMHGGPDPRQQMNVTIEAMTKLFTDMVAKNIDVDISVSLAFEMNGRIVRISSYGHIENQLYWLQNNFNFEHNEESLTKWVNDQRTYLNKFSRNISRTLLASITQMDGVLFIKRIPVDSEWKLNETDKGLVFTIKFSKEDEAFELFKNNMIRPVLCIKEYKAVWTDTGEDYYTSSRTRIDSNSSVSITDAEPLALYWTKGDS